MVVRGREQKERKGHCPSACLCGRRGPRGVICASAPRPRERDCPPRKSSSHRHHEAVILDPVEQTPSCVRRVCIPGKRSRRRTVPAPPKLMPSRPPGHGLRTVCRRQPRRGSRAAKGHVCFPVCCLQAVCRRGGAFGEAGEDQKTPSSIATPSRQVKRK